MINGKQVVALIPARSGSKGLPGKNMLMIAGCPLIAWTIRAATSSRIIDHVIVSSDSQEVLDLAADLGALPLDRPSDLATDSSLASELIRHAIEGGRIATSMFTYNPRVCCAHQYTLTIL